MQLLAGNKLKNNYFRNKVVTNDHYLWEAIYQLV